MSGRRSHRTAVAGVVTVVGYDGSVGADRALEHAIDHRDGGSLCIVHACELAPGLRGGERSAPAASASLAAAERLLRELPLRHPRLAEIKWSSRVLAGTASDALARIARESGASAIVVGIEAHGRPWGSFGVVHGLLREAPCPIVAVPVTLTQPAAA